MPASSFNRPARHPVDPDLRDLADAWGKAARTEVDHVKKAIAVAAHTECLRKIRQRRSGL